MHRRHAHVDGDLLFDDVLDALLRDRSVDEGRAPIPNLKPSSMTTVSE